MAITRPVKKYSSADDYISGAPDAASPRNESLVEAFENNDKPVKSAKHVLKGKKYQISLTIFPEMLARLDARAKKMGQGRAAIINLAIFQSLNEWEKEDSKHDSYR